MVSPILTPSSSTINAETTTAPASITQTIELQHNDSILIQLRELYPNHHSSIIRQAIVQAQPYERKLLEIRRIEAAAEFLLHQTPDTRPNVSEAAPGTTRPGGLEDWEKFRTEEYKNAVTAALSREFKWIRDASFRKVLFENNHDYFRCHTALTSLKSRSWISNIVSFFSTKPKETKPPTGCSELDHELIASKTRAERETQREKDGQLAQTVNEEQYNGSLFECQCCFGDYAWDDMAFCMDAHSFCKGCLKNSIQSILYNQGTGIDYLKGSVQCISSSASPPCTHVVSPQDLPHLIPVELFAALNEHLIKHALDESDMEVLDCPFCPYAIVEVPNEKKKRAFRLPTQHGVFVWLMCAVFYAVRWVVVECIIPGINWLAHRAGESQGGRPKWDTIFRCKNPRCGRDSCLMCGKEWIGIHHCDRTDEEQKQAFISRKMDEAMKRTCPKCHTSFLKDGGCNKMTCPCGAKMCYLCRTNITHEGYQHFCQHVRFTAGRCMECVKCSLYEEEKADTVLKATQAEAEAEWEERVQAKEQHATEELGRLKSQGATTTGRLQRRRRRGVV